ncbi:MAG: PCRF domain-containing protein, partial [Planctomycetota bacterium]
MQHENIPGILEEIQSRIAAMRDSMRVEENAARLKELEAKMGEPGFWDNQDTANEIIAELKRIKARIEPVNEVAAKIEDAQVLWDMAQEMDDQ